MPVPITIYTDGACRGNPGKGGLGIILMTEKHYKEVSRGYLRTTNNRMELLAVILGLEMLRQVPSQVQVYTDSKYVAEAVEKGWLLRWERTGFKKRLNVDLWQRFLKIYRQHQVSFIWVKGHADNRFNNRCDVLATQAADHGPWETDEGFADGG